MLKCVQCAASDFATQLESRSETDTHRLPMRSRKKKERTTRTVLTAPTIASSTNGLNEKRLHLSLFSFSFFLRSLTLFKPLATRNIMHSLRMCSRALSLSHFLSGVMWATFLSRNAEMHCVLRSSDYREISLS